jgi:hypothetical protein
VEELESRSVYSIDKLDDLTKLAFSLDGTGPEKVGENDFGPSRSKQLANRSTCLQLLRGRDCDSRFAPEGLQNADYTQRELGLPAQ